MRLLAVPVLSAVFVVGCAERGKSEEAPPPDPPPVATTAAPAVAPTNYVVPAKKWDSVKDIRKVMPKVGVGAPPVSSAAPTASADAAQ